MGIKTEIKSSTEHDEAAIVRNLSTVGIVGNILLCSFKLFAGIYGKSSAMISDAVHSLSDVFATLVAFIGVKLAQRPEDEEHQYGHEKIECIASLVLALILAGTAFVIGSAALKGIIHGSVAEVPSLLPLIAAVVSIIVKEAMFRYTMHYAIIIESDAFKADAWHHRSDAFSSIGALIGIAAARLGYPVMDYVAGLVICVFILKVAFEILRDALGKLVDRSCGEGYENALRESILTEDGVLAIDMLQTRSFGNKCYVDIEIAVDSASTLVEAHDIAENLHNRLERENPEIKHVMIHVNPYSANNESD